MKLGKNNLVDKLEVKSSTVYSLTPKGLENKQIV